MLLATTTADAMLNQRQVHVNGRDYTLCEYVGAAPLRGAYVEGNEVNDNGLPQGFLVEQPPGAITPAHFHKTNQFQVFVEGSGSMGKHAAVPLTVQYANGHTPYGPIKASETGIKYFTLRQRWDPGAKYMPGSRDLLIKGNQRSRINGNIPLMSDADRCQLPATLIAPVLEPEPDGMAAWLYSSGAGEALTLPSSAGTGGQYLVVVAGVLSVQDTLYDKWSTLFVMPDEPAPSISVTEHGLELLVLQFPPMM